MDKKKLLIAEGAEDLRLALADALHGTYQLRCCADGNQAKELICSFDPDIMVVDLMLPGHDGISLLQWAADTGRRPVVLAVSKFVNDYVVDALDRLGVGYLMVKPCDVRAVCARIGDLSMRIHPARTTDPDPKAQIVNMLHILGVPVKLRGHSYLREAIFRYAADTCQSITKELYPRVAEICCCAPCHVERSIRSAIEAAWKKRDDQLWRTYFAPDSTGVIPRPTNGAFISRLAECLRLEEGERMQSGDVGENTTLFREKC